MKTGRPKTQYRINIDFLKGKISGEVDIIIELYNRFLITHEEALNLIEKAHTPIEERDKGYKEVF